MIKNLKRHLKKLFILLLIMTFTIIKQNVNAVIYNDDNTAWYQYLETVKEISGDYTNCYHDTGKTFYNNEEASQSLFVLKQKQTENSKVVTWAVSSDNGKLRRANVATIASDYELHHPDWKVIGAINADQYVTGFGENIPSSGKDYYYPQPYYPMICDSEGWFIVTGIPVSGGQNIISFLQDGSDDPLLSGSANLKHGQIKLAGLFLYILDENDNRIAKYFVKAINETPYTNETTIWTSYYDKTSQFKDIDISGNLYVVNDAIRAYASNSIDYQYKPNDAYNSFFGKGIISDVCNKATIGYGDFAIDTNDQNLIALLEEGKKVLVQYELEGDYSNVESAIGYHTVQRDNNIDNTISQSNSYNTRRYPRAIVGRTASGEIVLVAIDGLRPNQNAAGANFWEINAILKNYGVVEAYQMDGGGSVTAVFRNGDSFDVVNSPSDGSPRANLSALLLVERRKPEAKLEVVDINSNNVTLNLDFDMHGYKLEDVTININNKEYAINKDNKIIINDLERGNNYSYDVNIKYLQDSKVITETISDNIKINKLKPVLDSCVMTINNDEYLYKIKFIDDDHTISTCFIQIDGVKYTLFDGVIKTPISDYIPYLQYSYDIGNGEKSESLKYPHSNLLRMIDNNYWYINNFALDILN